MVEKCWYDSYSHDYMDSSLSISEIEIYVDKQLELFFPDNIGGGGL